MSRPVALIVEGRALQASALESGLEANQRPVDGKASTLLASAPRLRECDLIVLAGTAEDSVKRAERLAMDLARELKRTVRWAHEPLVDALDLAAIERSAVRCDPPPPLTTCFADIDTVTLRWLVPALLPEGKLAVIAGQPGLGKSMLTVEAAARLSRGEGFPGENPPVGPADTLFLSSEDDPGDTIRPRLQAAGADLHRIHTSRAPSLDGLGAMLDELPRCRLVVVDPLGAYLGHTNSYKDAEVRRFLAPLEDLCRVRGVTILFVAHLNKNEISAAINRIGGSIGIVAACRIAWAVGRDREDPDRVLLVPLKNNLGPRGSGWSFRVKSGEPEATGRISFEPERVHVSADEVLGSGQRRSDGAGARDSARVWLASRLKHGPVPSSEVEDEAKKQGITVATLRRARTELGVESRKDGAGGAWRLHPVGSDGQGAQDVQGAQHAQRAQHPQGVQGAQAPDVSTLSTLEGGAPSRSEAEPQTTSIVHADAEGEPRDGPR